MNIVGFKRLTGLLLAALIAGASIWGVTAAMSNHHGKIKPVLRSDGGARTLAKSVFQGHRKYFANSNFVTTPPGNHPMAVSTDHMAGFPTRGKSFAIMTNGCPRLASRPNNSRSTGCSDSGLKIRGARDVSIWKIKFRVPKGRTCLSFKFKFLSDEFPEFVDSDYNDAFIAEATRAPRWDAGSKTDPKLLARHNFASTRKGKLISVNGAGRTRMFKRAAYGTTYDGATRMLRASTRVKPGKRLLYLSIFDQGDRQYDSAVFIDQMRLKKTNNCKSGVAKTK
ncbi:MAG: choice-of-anchor L domain-containing protein [Solirubrobacterales bacterium]|nr:choice-of-anchor L domain-containing protein [Solirubrobacterales bacterium]